MPNSNKNKKAIISEKIEKSLRDWKLPPSSASDIFGPRDGFCCIPNWKVNTVEKAISLPPGESTFPLFSSCRKRAHQILCNNFVHVGMIQVGLKPTKIGSSTSAILILSDKRIETFYDSLLGMVESSLCEGPIYFSYFPNYPVPLCDSSDAFSIDVKIRGYEKITLMYKLHYKVMQQIDIFDHLENISRGSRNDKNEETTLFVTDIAQSNRVVSKKISWDAIGEGLEVEDEEVASGAVGNAKIDWKETAEAHMLKADVPGFKKEEVKVEVEAGRILQISGERSNDEEDVNDEWHCLERSNGKFVRRLKLPEKTKLEELTAAMENGVLTVTVPKELEVDNKVINISG